jgi:DNA-binding MarR family transcriptional regulator
MASLILTAEPATTLERRDEIVADLSQVPDAPDSWAELVAQADADSLGWFAVVADRTATAVATGDRTAITGLLDVLRGVDADLARAGDAPTSARRHAVRAVIEVLGALRGQLVVEHPAIRPHSEVGLVLITMFHTPGATNAQIAEAARLDPSQVSRTGRRLQALGLAHATRFGRENAWQLTPRGRQVAERLAAGSDDERGSAAGRLANWAVRMANPVKNAVLKGSSEAEKAARPAEQLLDEPHRSTSDTSAMAPAKEAAIHAPMRAAATKAPAKSPATKAAARKAAPEKTPVKKAAAATAPAKRAAARKSAAPAKNSAKTPVRKAAAKMPAKARA